MSYIKRRLKDMAKKINWFKENGYTIVWTNGCFDILHAGHVDYLKKAGKKGDVLVVGMNSDKSMQTIKRKPINKEEDRAAILESLRFVHLVLIFDDLEPSRIIKELKPDICCKGADWKNKYVPEKKVVEDYGGKFMFIPLKKGYSTTKIIKRCVEAGQ